MASQRNGHVKVFRTEQKCKVRTNPQKQRKESRTRRKSIVDLKRNRRKAALKVKQMETLL